MARHEAGVAIASVGRVGVPSHAAHRAAPIAVVIGPMPPPRHGQAVSNMAAIGALEAAGWRVRVIDTSPGLLNRGVAYYSRRIWRLVACVLTALRLRWHRPGLVYCGLSGGAGLAADTVLLRLAAGKRHDRVLLHHHNFTYIDADSRWMRLNLQWGPKRAMHLLLCSCMRDRFIDRYGLDDEATRVVNNLTLRRSGGALGVDTPLSRVRAEKLTVGFLGALSAEKGFDLFAEVCQRVEASGCGGEVVFECAGIIVDDMSAELLRSNPELNYVGVLDADGVDSFLRRMSLILFPSRYVNEAQPNVIIEALSAGVPVLATERGCVAELLGPNLASYLTTEADFVARATELIELTAADASVRSDACSSAEQQYGHLVALSAAQQSEWADVVSLRCPNV